MKKKNHYETLGVSKNASLEEIKKAYRKKIKEAHPDVNNGEDQEAKALTIAYSTLKDEKKRKNYDETGENIIRGDDYHIKNMCLDAFGKALASGKKDIVKQAKKLLEEQRAGCETQRTKTQRALEDLKKKRNKVIRKDGEDKENLVNLILDQQISQIEETLKQMSHAIDLGGKALDEIDKYESLEKDEEEIHKSRITPEDIRRVKNYFYIRDL